MLFTDTELYACEWLKGVDVYYDRPVTPKDLTKEAEKEAAKPKKVMRLIREEDDGIINKEEGSKDITSEDIQKKNEVLRVDIERKKAAREKRVEGIGKAGEGGEVKPEKKLVNRLALRRGTEEKAGTLVRRKISYNDETVKSNQGSERSGKQGEKGGQLNLMDKRKSLGDELK